MTMIWYQCPIKQYVSITNIDGTCGWLCFRLEILASTPGTETIVNCKKLFDMYITVTYEGGKYNCVMLII